MFRLEIRGETLIFMSRLFDKTMTILISHFLRFGALKILTGDYYVLRINQIIYSKQKIECFIHSSRLICHYQPCLFPLLYFLSLMFHTVPVGLSVIYITIHLALEFLHWLQHIHTSQWDPDIILATISAPPLFFCSRIVHFLLMSSVANLFSLCRAMLGFCSYICYRNQLLMWPYFTYM